MRNMSFALTREQLLAGKKTVTRRKGSAYLRPGERVQAVEKIQGLKRGEKVKPICVIEVVSVRREPLAFITQPDVIAEGFPELTVAGFVAMFCKHHAGVTPETEITRIEFKVVES